MKQCTRCKRWLDESEFHKHKASKAGLKSQCKACRNAENREYYKRPEVKKHRVEYSREYQKNHPEETREKGRRYRKRNPEKYVESVMRYYWKNRDLVLKKKKLYRKKPEVKEINRIQKRNWVRKNPEKTKVSKKRYYENHKEDVLKKCKEYRNTPDVKEQNRIKKKIYRNKNKDKVNARVRAYRHSLHGSEIKKRSDAKRRRNLKWVLLFDNPFPEDVFVDFHHVNKLLVVPLPHQIHNNLCGRPIEAHYKFANMWIEKLYCLDMDRLLSLTSF